MLWRHAERFAKECGDIFAVQPEIVGQLANRHFFVVVAMDEVSGLPYIFLTWPACVGFLLGSGCNTDEGCKQLIQGCLLQQVASRALACFR
ncbi:hypothetical protein D3C84_836050 [compost metagenome]